MAGHPKRKPTKRTYGQGSIYQTGDIWYYQPPARYGVRQKRIRCADREAAELAQTRYLAERANEEPDIDPRAADTLHGWINLWWTQYKAPTLAKSTRHQAQGQIESYILGMLRDVNLTELSTDGLIVWRNELAAHVAPARAKRVYGLFKAALDQAVANRKLTYNPLAAVPAPIVRRTETDKHVLSDEELLRVLDSLTGERATFAYLSAVLGFRRGEGLGIRLADIDWQRHSLRITGQMQTIGRVTERTNDTKTHRSRLIALPAEMMPILDGQRRAVYERRLRDGPLWQDQDLLFPGKHGGPQIPEVVSQWWMRHVLRCDLPRSSIHKLRDGAITRMEMLGVHTVIVKKITGHELDVHGGYVKVTDDDQRRALLQAMTAMERAKKARRAK